MARRPAQTSSVVLAYVSRPLLQPPRVSCPVGWRARANFHRRLPSRLIREISISLLIIGYARATIGFPAVTSSRFLLLLFSVSLFLLTRPFVALPLLTPRAEDVSCALLLNERRDDDDDVVIARVGVAHVTIEQSR